MLSIRILEPTSPPCQPPGAGVCRKGQASDTEDGSGGDSDRYTAYRKKSDYSLNESTWSQTSRPLILVDESFSLLLPTPPPLRVSGHSAMNSISTVGPQCDGPQYERSGIGSIVNSVYRQTTVQ